MVGAKGAPMQLILSSIHQRPKPSDFFRAVESAGGEDLSWFWRAWRLNNWTLEMEVENRGQLVLPATLRVTFQDGTRRDIRVPVETWMQSGSHVFAINAVPPAVEAVIDPDHRIPDRDRSNNSVRRAPAA